MTPEQKILATDSWKEIQKRLLNQMHQRMIEMEFSSIQVCQKAAVPAKRWNDYVTCRKPLLIDDVVKICDVLNLTTKLTFSKL